MSGYFDFSQCIQDMVASVCSCQGAHLTHQRKVKSIQSTHFTYSNGLLQDCNSTSPCTLTCLKLARFLILSGTTGACEGGGIQGGFWLSVSVPFGVCWEVLVLVLRLIEGTGGKGPFFRAREMDAPADLGIVCDTGPVKHARALP